MLLDKDNEECERLRKEKAELLQRGKSVFKELLLHLFFIWIVVSISYGTNDKNSYYVYKTVADTFFSSFRNKVNKDYMHTETWRFIFLCNV